MSRDLSEVRVQSCQLFGKKVFQAEQTDFDIRLPLECLSLKQSNRGELYKMKLERRPESRTRQAVEPVVTTLDI